MSILISDLAREDLENIRAYTCETWGRDQWLKYYKDIVSAFDNISENPEAGTDRSLFVEGMRSVNCNRHVIFFKRLDRAEHKPVILRIVHGRQNLPALVYYDDLNSV